MPMTYVAAEQIPTIDGILAAGQRIRHSIRRTPVLSEPLLKVDKVLTISEAGTTDAMAVVWRYFRMLIESSSATVIAAIAEHPEYFTRRRVGAVISGGNIDLGQLPFKP